MNWGRGDVGCQLLFSYCRGQDGQGAWNIRGGFSEQGDATKSCLIWVLGLRMMLVCPRMVKIVLQGLGSGLKDEISSKCHV